MKSGSRYGGNSKGKLWDSDDEDTSSEEDFHWLQKQLHQEGELDDESMRLLRGVLTETFKDRKFPESHIHPK
jgi:hypothetical protein